MKVESNSKKKFHFNGILVERPYLKFQNEVSLCAYKIDWFIIISFINSYVGSLRVIVSC